MTQWTMLNALIVAQAVMTVVFVVLIERAFFSTYEEEIKENHG